MNNMKRILFLTTTFSALVAGHCANAMDPDEIENRITERDKRIEEVLEQFGTTIFSAASEFYKGLAQIGVQSIHEDLKAQKEMPVNKANTKETKRDNDKKDPVKTVTQS